MDRISNICGSVIHYVYTWLPKTPVRRKKRKKTRRREDESFDVLLQDRHQDPRLLPLASTESAIQCPFPPAVSTSTFLYFSGEECRRNVNEDVTRRFSFSNFEVVGYKFLSTEKKLSKRSALKRWIRQRTSVGPAGITAQGRHNACTKVLFEVTAKTDGRIISFFFFFSYLNNYIYSLHLFQKHEAYLGNLCNWCSYKNFAP